MHRTTTRLARWAAAATIGSLGLLSFLPVDGAQLEISPHASPFVVGEFASFELTGNDGDFALFMIDTDPGNSVLPYLGGIPISLGQSSRFNTLFRALTGGSSTVGCEVTCDNVELWGVPLYMQAVTLNPVTREVCVTNRIEVVWEENGLCTCGPCDGKVASLTMRYDGADAAQITVRTRKLESVIFDDIVLPGEEFSFVGDDKKGTMGPEIRVHVNGGEPTEIHTSCSQPIGPGLSFGDFTVISGTSRNGGVLCSLDD